MYDALLVKKRDRPWVLLVTALAAAVFFVGQIGGVFISVLVLGLFFMGADQVDSIFADDSYWPKLFALVLISGLIIWLTFRASAVLSSIDAKYRNKKTKEAAHTATADEPLITSGKKPKKKSLQVAGSHLTFLMLPKRFPRLGELGEAFGIYGLYFISTLVVSTILGIIGFVNAEQTQDLGIAQPGSHAELFAVFVMLVVLPPIAEEILFRGFLFNGLKRYSGIAVSYALTCILFGIAHLELGNGDPNWIAAVDTMLFSGFLIFASQRHQSLYSSMFMHALKNSIAFYILFSGNF